MTGTATATINDRPITVAPRETLLQAALRQGVPFPHGCRVGGCASCRCRLVEGKVRELTETAYLLSDQELDRGFILACQAVPTGDIRVEVELGRAARPERAEVEAETLGAAVAPAGLLQYLKYALFHAVGLFAAAALFAGGPIVFGALQGIAAATPGQLVSACILTGLMVGMVGTIPAHELTHRTWDPVSLWVGRWLLAFSFDASFSVEHVYGHHRYVSTAEDPATAPRTAGMTRRGDLTRSS